MESNQITSPLWCELNPQQRQAVEMIDGPLLILAGAGSGKTRVITYRIAHLIEGVGIPPHNILAVTFTNKAADQMKERVFQLLQGRRSDNPLICTFHSLCVRILRRDIERMDYSRNFAIYDEADQEAVMKTCLKEVGLDTKAITPRSALAQISYAKNHGLSPQSLYGAASNPQRERLAILYDLYERKLRGLNALDFDDLLLRTVDLLGQFPEVRDFYNDRFRYVLVDEYQDTNQVQYRLIRHLTRSQQNLCVVGDEDQSIYRWRGADILNILNFEQDYPQTRLIKLEQNYRSTQVILDAATAVVSNNLARKGKTLWTDRKGGEKIGFMETPEAEGEALFVSKKAQEVLEQEPDSKMAVLYRTNAQSRLFEEAFRRLGLAYKIVGGFSFYERAEIKDVLSYLRFALNVNDEISLSRVINTPPRGIGKSTIDVLQERARQEGTSVWKTIESVLAEKRLAERTLHSLEKFHAIIMGIQDKIETAPLSESIDFIIESSGYRRMLEDEDTEESLSRLENLNELVNAAVDADARGETLRDFLDHAALVSDQDSYDEKAPVSLMTIHSAKGLEFRVVFVVGLEEDLFPHSRSLFAQEELEEERRLFYVAMTRAQQRLFLTRVRNRRSYGAESSDATEASRFLSEIPPELLDNLSYIQPHIRANRVFEGSSYNTVDHIKQLLKERGIAAGALSGTRSSKPATRLTKPSKWKSKFQLGSQVRHPKYGIGTVLRSEGEGDDLKLSVQFPRYGLKKLVEKYAGLEEA